jgi:nucleoside-diphosphate-sugar epimerase
MPRKRISDYGVCKAAIERDLLDQARQLHFPAVMLHPGHLVGAAWIPLNFNPVVFADLAAGGEISLPNFGPETLDHVHADDVAQAFIKARAN